MTISLCKHVQSVNQLIFLLAEITRCMAQLELTLPQTHTQQEEQDRQDATRLFYSSLEVLAENDPDTSHNETATILNCTQEAERESRVEEHRVCEEIAGELCGIADQVTVWYRDMKSTLTRF